MSFRILQLSSPQNPLLQDVRQAAARGRATGDGLLVVEGPHLVEELARGSWQVRKLLFTSEVFPAWEKAARDFAVETIVIPERVFSSIAATETSQGVIALVRSPAWNWHDLLGNPTLLVALDGVQDPGNAGTIVRSAEAFGATGIVLIEPSVRLSNGKLMRASAGSLFRLPVCGAMPAGEFISKARESRLPLFSLSSGGTAALSQARLEQHCALVVGSEGSGVSPALLAAGRSICVPTSRVESLNAAVACSIALYEAARQRSDVLPVNCSTHPAMAETAHESL